MDSKLISFLEANKEPFLESLEEVISASKQTESFSQEDVLKLADAAYNNLVQKSKRSRELIVNGLASSNDVYHTIYGGFGDIIHKYSDQIKSMPGVSLMCGDEPGHFPFAAKNRIKTSGIRYMEGMFMFRTLLGNKFVSETDDYYEAFVIGDTTETNLNPVNERGEPLENNPEKTCFADHFYLQYVEDPKWEPDKRRGCFSIYTLSFPHNNPDRYLSAILRDPSILIDCFRKVFPHFDRSEGRLRLSEAQPLTLTNNMKRGINPKFQSDFQYI